MHHEKLTNYCKIGEDKNQVEDMVVKYTNKPAGYFPIAMTEFNARAGLRNISRTNALFISMCLGEFATYDYDAAILWDMQNGYDAATGDHGIVSNKDPILPDFSANPTLYVYYYFNTYFGDYLISSASSDTMVKAYSTTFHSGEIGMVLVNKDSKPHTIKVNINNTVLGQRLYWHTITGAGDMDRAVYINGQGSESFTVSGPQDYETVLPLSMIIQDTVKLTLPAYSANYVLAEINTTKITDINTKSFSIFPNPTNEMLNVTLRQAQGDNSLKINGNTNQELKIFTIDGREIFSSSLNIYNSTFNISDIPTGLYFVRIGNEVQKLIINH